MGVMKIVNKNSSIKDNKIFKILLITVSITVLVVLSIFAFNLFNRYKDLDNAGEKCVEYLYSFNSLADLQENDEKLKNLCTDEVYKKLTATNVEKSLNVYLKLKGKPTEIVILDSVKSSNGGYVVYSLKNENITQTRKFLFLYEISKGKVSKVREMEGIDFS